MTNHIKLLKPGRHTDTTGVAYTYTEAELKACAEAYDPRLFRAPIRAEMAFRAYGWLRSISFVDGHLVGEPEEVDPDFAEAVNAGTYPRLNISFYLPDAPRNPSPGIPYLRGIAFQTT